MRTAELAVQPVQGDHSLQHWQKIHKFMFQDVYEWAGELRTISLFKEFDSPYSESKTIPSGFTNLINPILRKTNHLKACTDSDILKEISGLMGELYSIHPFSSPLKKGLWSWREPATGKMRPTGANFSVGLAKPRFR